MMELVRKTLLEMALIILYIGGAVYWLILTLSWFGLTFLLLFIWLILHILSMAGELFRRIYFTPVIYLYSLKQPDDDSWLWGEGHWAKMVGAWKSAKYR